MKSWESRAIREWSVGWSDLGSLVHPVLPEGSHRTLMFVPTTKTQQDPREIEHPIEELVASLDQTEGSLP